MTPPDDMALSRRHLIIGLSGLGARLGLAGRLRLAAALGTSGPVGPTLAEGVDLHTEAGSDPDATVSLRRARLLGALDAGFAIQYWGKTYTAPTLAQAGFGLLILELTTQGADPDQQRPEIRFSNAQIDHIRQGGTRPVLGYLNLGEIAPYRDGADQIAPIATLAGGDLLAPFWHDGWQAQILARVDRLMETGIDGLFLDDILHYYTFLSEPQLGPKGIDFAVEMARLVIAVAAHARLHNPQALIVVNNGVYLENDIRFASHTPDATALLGPYYTAIDGILIEALFEQCQSAKVPANAIIETLKRRFLTRDIPVLCVDFQNRLKRHEPAFRRWAGQHGFVPYLAPDPAFDRLGAG